MGVLGFLFFAAVLAVAVGTIVATIKPRLSYIVALLDGAIVAPQLVPVAQRRRVRRLNPLSFRSEARLLRAAA